WLPEEDSRRMRALVGGAVEGFRAGRPENLQAIVNDVHETRHHAWPLVLDMLLVSHKMDGAELRGALATLPSGAARRAVGEALGAYAQYEQAVPYVAALLDTQLAPVGIYGES